MAKHYFLTFTLLISYIISAQNINFHKGEIWLGGTFGISFHNDDLARINQQTYLGQPEIQNQLAFQFLPKAEYAVFNKFLLGAHLGFGMNVYKSNNSSNVNIQKYKAGVHARYYIIQLLPKLFLQSEIGINYNYLDNANSNYNTYLKSYLDGGISFNISEYWLASLTFKDILSYHSDEPNFENKSNLSNNNFSDFINFPYFSLMYRFN